MECESDDDTSSEWYTWNNPQRIGTGSGRLGNKTSGNHPDFSMIKIGKKLRKVLETWGGLQSLKLLQKTFC